MVYTEYISAVIRYFDYGHLGKKGNSSNGNFSESIIYHEWKDILGKVNMVKGYFGKSAYGERIFGKIYLCIRILHDLWVADGFFTLVGGVCCP